MDFQNEFRIKTRDIEKIIYSYLPPVEGLQKTCIEAMNYSVRAGGKRLRPMLMYETYRLFGGCEAVVEPFMAAIEMIHTYSLVHDDLPAIDNDIYRRGKKSTHAEFGEAMGILAGDALLNFAFETALKAFAIKSDKCTAEAMTILARKAGIYGMIGGQVVDVETEGKPNPLETIEFIHKLKCGALIEASMMIGTVLAGAKSEQVAIIESCAADVGLAFQIRDDILDVTSSLEVTGKSSGNDAKNNKTTYVTLVGLDKAQQAVNNLSDRALSSLASLPYKNSFLEELIKMLVGRNK